MEEHEKPRRPGVSLPKPEIFAFFPLWRILDDVNARPAIEGAGTRTRDLRIKSPLLYRLSYALGVIPS